MSKPCSTLRAARSTDGCAWSAVQFILFAASGVFADQRLKHPREPRGKPFGSDNLGRDASALAYQENFVGDTLGIDEPSIAAQANKPFSDIGLILPNDTPRRMVRVRQFDRSVGESTTALGLVRLEVTDMAQPGQKLAFRIAHVGGSARIPGNVEILLKLTETGGDQHVLRGEVAIERHLVGTGRRRNCVGADGMYASAIEQLASGREDALAWWLAAAPFPLILIQCDMFR
jgi:hypothetical protein